MASTSRSPALSTVLPSGRNRRNRRSSTQVIRAQSYRDEGRGKHEIVDENLQVLRERIEDVKIREKLERCLTSEAGWNYAPICDYKQHKKELEQSHQLMQLVCTVGGTVGFTVLTCTLCLCLISILIHLSM